MFRERLQDHHPLKAEQALEDHSVVIRYVVRMLCAGLIHGDLSEFNVLVDDHGPVIIDLPQVIDAAANNQARQFFERDVNKITDYYALFAPQLSGSQYAREIRALFEAGDLQPDVALTGRFEEDAHDADVDGVLEEIKVAMVEEQNRQERLREENAA